MLGRPSLDSSQDAAGPEKATLLAGHLVRFPFARSLLRQGLSNFGGSPSIQTSPPFSTPTLLVPTVVFLDSRLWLPCSILQCPSKVNMQAYFKHDNISSMGKIGKMSKLKKMMTDIEQITKSGSSSPRQLTSTPSRTVPAEPCIAHISSMAMPAAPAGPAQCCCQPMHSHSPPDGVV